MSRTFFRDFRTFLKEYQIVTLAIAFVMGGSSQALIKSFVDNIVMPFIAIALPKGTWQQATLDIGPLALKWGAFVAELINFLLLALVVFLIVKKLVKQEKEEDKKEKAKK